MTSANENLPAGMGGLKFPVSQVSLVVNDLHRTMERYYEAFGWTGWRSSTTSTPMHHGTQLRGRAVPYSLRGAEVMVGDLNFELLEPIEGPSLWREFLAARGEGIASIAVMFDTHEESANRQATGSPSSAST